MSGRFAAPILAFAVAVSVAAHTTVLPEFLLQLRDPNTLGGPLFTALLHGFGYAFVLGICGILAGAALLLVSWRTRARGASDWYAALAAIIAALCLLGRLGVSLDPIGWLCAAAFCLLLERNDRTSAYAACGVVLVWAILQGGAPLAAVIAVLWLAGVAYDARPFCLRPLDPRIARAGGVAIGAIVLGGLQLHALPWHAYGAHALYLDAMAPGAARNRIWMQGFTWPSLGFVALLMVAGWYGIRRRARSADALVFFALFVLALFDARNLPYLGIVGAPIVADAMASFYIEKRTLPIGTLRSYAITFATAAFAFLATLMVAEHRSTVWPDAAGTPGGLFAVLAQDGQRHRVLCIEPRWCDEAVLAPARMLAVMDDRSGVQPRSMHRLQADVETAAGPWHRELKAARVDAVLARHDDKIIALLGSFGWRVRASDDGSVLLRPGR